MYHDVSVLQSVYINPRYQGFHSQLPQLPQLPLRILFKHIRRRLAFALLQPLDFIGGDCWQLRLSA